MVNSIKQNLKYFLKLFNLMEKSFKIWYNEYGGNNLYGSRGE